MSVKLELSADHGQSGVARHEHKERHTGSSVLIRDAIIGLADGLTVPFALTAGLSALGSSRLVVIGGLAELFSGAISMGLGAFLASTTERQQYDAEEKRERRKTLEQPDAEVEKIYEVFHQYGISRVVSRPAVQELIKNEDLWVQFMMHFELNLSKPAGSRAWMEGLVTGFAYFIGGLFPMIPYFAIKEVDTALFISIGITAAILLVFGYVKALITGLNRRGLIYSSLQTLFVGALAAGVSYGVVRGIDSSNTL